MAELERQFVIHVCGDETAAPAAAEPSPDAVEAQAWPDDENPRTVWVRIGGDAHAISREAAATLALELGWAVTELVLDEVAVPAAAPPAVAVVADAPNA